MFKIICEKCNKEVRIVQCKGCHINEIDIKFQPDTFLISSSFESNDISIECCNCGNSLIEGIIRNRPCSTEKESEWNKHYCTNDCTSCGYVKERA